MSLESWQKAFISQDYENDCAVFLKVNKNVL